MISNFLPTSEFKWLILQTLIQKKSSFSSKRCILEFDIEYPKQLQELHYGYVLAPDKIESKEMLSKYQLIIANIYKTLIGNVKKLVSKFFNKENYCFLMKNCNFIYS